MKRSVCCACPIIVYLWTSPLLMTVNLKSLWKCQTAITIIKLQFEETSTESKSLRLTRRSSVTMSCVPHFLSAVVFPYDSHTDRKHTRQYMVPLHHQQEAAINEHSAGNDLFSSSSSSSNSSSFASAVAAFLLVIVWIFFWSKQMVLKLETVRTFELARFVCFLLSVTLCW